VIISYTAEPKTGLHFRTPNMGYPEAEAHFFTQGETHYHPHWFPSYDYPNERATSEIICHTEKDFTVLSNGKLVSESIDPQSGLKTSHWLQDKPHTNYLIALVAGRFKKVEDKYRDIPLAYYTLPSLFEYCEYSFSDTADIMGFFENETGIDYPWNKYYQVAVADFTSGAMENTTLTVHNDWYIANPESQGIRTMDWLNAHEMAHQWFGNYVTCKDWANTWLNEGFATYYQKLYSAHKYGTDQMLYEMYEDASQICGSGLDKKKPIHHRHYSSAWEQFNFLNYKKGGWVLHMLRSQLGPDLYRKCIKTYLQRNAYRSTVTGDLNSVIEELSGVSYDRFFDQWIFQAGSPELKIDYKWSQKDRLAKVSIEQTQKKKDDEVFYHLPAIIRFTVQGNAVDKEILIDEKQQDFYFALDSKPDIVRFDPEYTILAKIEFKKPKEMLYQQLFNENDTVGRILAARSLEKHDDKKTVEKLKKALNSDPFYGVRQKAASALQKIQTDQAFKAITASIDNQPAKARIGVVKSLAGFYRPETIDHLINVIETEQNPLIVNEAIVGLGRFSDPRCKKIILEKLKADSFRNQACASAIKAINMLKDEEYADILMDTIKQREQEFTSWNVGEALKTLGRISSTMDDKTQVLEFLTGYAYSKKDLAARGAIEAIGLLKEPRAIGILKTFTGNNKYDRRQETANKALKELNKKAELVPEELVEIRNSLEELQNENTELKDSLEDLKKKYEAFSDRTPDPNDITEKD
jgi:aminopeptidase N